ncbi:MAG: hypothetical protein H7301_14515 [Cryobacterium sp.]|nr:hypothetical protein [Oligoflexia bacterium]
MIHLFRFFAAGFALGILALTSVSVSAAVTAPVNGRVESFDRSSMVLKMTDGTLVKLKKSLLSIRKQQRLRVGQQVHVVVDRRDLLRSVVGKK